MGARRMHLQAVVVEAKYSQIGEPRAATLGDKQAPRYPTGANTSCSLLT